MSGFGGAGADRGARATRWLVRALSTVTGTMMFSMMALTFVDVVARYVFNSPIGARVRDHRVHDGGADFFRAAPYYPRPGGISRLVCSTGCSPFSSRVLDTAACLFLVFSAGAVGFIASRLWSQAETMREIQEPGEYLDFEIAPLVYVLSALSLIAFVILLGMVVDYIRRGPVGGARRIAAETGLTWLE